MAPSTQFRHSETMRSIEPGMQLDPENLEIPRCAIAHLRFTLRVPRNDERLVCGVTGDEGDYRRRWNWRPDRSADAALARHRLRAVRTVRHHPLARRRHQHAAACDPRTGGPWPAREARCRGYPHL